MLSILTEKEIDEILDIPLSQNDFTYNFLRTVENAVLVKLASRLKDAERWQYMRKADNGEAYNILNPRSGLWSEDGDPEGREFDELTTEEYAVFRDLAIDEQMDLSNHE